MKNIWLINHYAGTPKDSDTLRHYNFAKNLIAKGYRVTIFTASTVHNRDIQRIKDNVKYSVDTSMDVPFVYIKTRPYRGNGIDRIINMVEFYFKVLKYANLFEKPDLVWGSSVHPLACVAAIQLAKKYHCKNICEIRDLWPESIIVYGNMTEHNPIIKLLYILEKWIYKKSDELIFTMQGGWDYIVEKGWDGEIQKEKVHHINNGVDLELFEYNKEHFRLQDEDLSDPNTFKVIYTGSVKKSNNLSILVDAAKILQSEQIKTKVIVYGQGEELAYLRKRVVDENIDNILFKGRVDKNYIPFILSHGDLNVTDLYESPLFKYGVSPNKLFDYFASKRRILMCLNCQYDLVTKYSCGKKMNTINAVELAKEIKNFYFMSNDVTLEMERNAAKAAHDYDYKSLTEDIIKIIER